MDKQEFNDMNAHDKLFWARRSAQLAHAMGRINGKDITTEDIEQVRKAEDAQFERMVLAIQKILVDEDVCEHATGKDGEVIKSQQGIPALTIKGKELNYLYALTTIESLFAAAVATVYQGVAINCGSNFMRVGLHQVMLDALCHQWTDAEVKQAQPHMPSGISDLLEALTQPTQ